MTSKKIFVSRSLSHDSLIRKTVPGAIITDQSLIQFSPLPFEAPESDWVFFYSRNGVKYFFEDSNFELYPFNWACMSSGTAEELSKYILDISFVGKGSPAQISSDFEKLLGTNESVTFIRAEHSIDSIKNMLGAERAVSVPVYSNTPLATIPDDDFDILIFTSPMNVKTWYSKTTKKGEIVIAIGQTTGSALVDHKISKVLVADDPSEAGIAGVLETTMNQ